MNTQIIPYTDTAFRVVAVNPGQPVAPLGLIRAEPDGSWSAKPWGMPERPAPDSREALRIVVMAGLMRGEDGRRLA